MDVSRASGSGRIKCTVRMNLVRADLLTTVIRRLFSSTPSNVGVDSSPGGLGGGLSSPLGKTRRRAFPMGQVVDIIVKSSKTPISAGELFLSGKIP